MKHKKYILIFGFLALTSILLAVPVRGQYIEGILPPNSFVRVHGTMNRNDGYIFEFVSSTSEIAVAALNDYEYSVFINLQVSEYTAMLSYGKFYDYEIWRPPYSSYWHIIYVNLGDVETYIIIQYSIPLEYYSKDLDPYSLIIGFIGFFAVVGTGGVIFMVQKRREQREVKL
ncbi:MAG: hypothetical protein ACFFA0_05980 [Promethearchaeota archaeon]